ncbi:superfamily II DNA or RNA helicase [Jatrophihabitans sp. GAS493]|uniref:DEAD/DEAH box helicase n=1 Tax=Jatrophihabitans sp. GAS493 TaxID=1907575 RepID=UPI000BBF3E87|nr:DEAD/DEAH box helicase family protein [Jatrophihabitans sp. GAS493]SOD74093.1 superfamily II DNA or RNA helicase [Jatrophihabitans sp. GAS493]
MTAAPAPDQRLRLRAWQQEALQRYHAGDEIRRDFLVTATPGAGKTTFALALAASLLARRVIDRIVVVCPTDHLRTQWAQAAERAGLSIDPTLTNAVGPVRADSLGYITTYAQVAMKPQLHAARVNNKRTLVILDEVHHAGDGLSWGDAVAEAFGGASRRLCLTGTPFRTRPDELIPFVRYANDGAGGQESSADYNYGYREALRDGVVRPVVFAAYTGTARWRNSAGEVVAASLTEAATKQTEALAWKTALNPKGQWVAHVIAAMDERITHLRRGGVGDAAGIVLASDQEDAREYAGIVEQVTGEKPVLILSDDPKASDKITAFTNGTERIAVCVRMVSEGVDVPRAACLAWMTSYRTPLFFAQAVGRVVRARGPHESATVFLPAVRPLLTLAAALEEDRNHVIPPPAAASESLDIDPVEREAADRVEYEALDADAQFAHLLHGGRAVVATAREPVELSEDDEHFLGIPGLLSPEQTAQLLSDRDSAARRRATSVADAPPSQEVASWRAAGELRREVNKLVAIYAARAGMPHAQVHAQIRRAVGGPPSASATAELLEQRRDHLLLLLER